MVARQTDCLSKEAAAADSVIRLDLSKQTVEGVRHADRCRTRDGSSTRRVVQETDRNAVRRRVRCVKVELRPSNRACRGGGIAERDRAGDGGMVEVVERSVEVAQNEFGEVAELFGEVAQSGVATRSAG